MALLTQPSDYVSGKISLTNGSVDFTGTATAWQLVGLREGDLLIDVAGATQFWAIIGEITSNTAGKLTRPWAGPDLVAVDYRMRFTSDGQRSTAQAAMLRQELGNGNIQALAGLDGSANQIAMFTGPGAMTLVPKTDLVSGAAYDVQVADIAARAAYNGQALGFAVLVADTGDGRSAIYSKNSNTSADWSAPAYLTGPVGPEFDVTIGEVTTLSPGQPASITPNYYLGGVELDFALPQGPAGDIDGVTPFWQDRITVDSTAVAAKNALGIEVSVKDFGAVGDFNTNDTAAFQAAAAFLQSQGGGTLLVPAGYYTLTATVNVPNRSRVVGSGRGASKINAVGCTPFYSPVGNEDIDIRSLRIFGDGTNGKSGVVLYNNPRGVILHDLRISGFTGAPGVVLDGETDFNMWGATLGNILVENCRGGIRLHNTNATLLNNVITRQMSYYGLEAIYTAGGDNSGTITANACVFETVNSTYGAVSGTAYAIHMVGILSSTFNSTYIERCDDGQIFLENCENIVFNGLFGNGNNGVVIPNGLVRMEGCKSCVFVGPDIHGMDNGIGSGKAAVYLDANCDGNTFVSANIERDGSIGPGNFPIIDLGTNNQFINPRGPNLGNYASRGANGAPTIQFGGASTGMTFSGRSCKWERTGRLVTAEFEYNFSAKGTATGTATIQLPADAPMPASVPVGHIGGFFNMAALSQAPVLSGAVGSRSITMRVPNGTTGVGSMTDANFTNTSSFAVVVQYFAF